jgi:hypothetical protein
MNNSINYTSILLIGTEENQQEFPIAQFTTEQTKRVRWMDFPTESRTAEATLMSNIRKVTRSTLIVNFDTCCASNSCTQIMRVARMLDIEIIHHSRFTKNDITTND